MAKKKVRALVLVLASHNNSIYQNARLTWKAYANHDPDISTFMVYGNTPGGLPDKDEYDLVYPEIPENYNPGMLKKTVRAMEYLHANYEYDFFIRTNISTFWDFRNLKRHLAELPSSKCYSGDGPLTPNGYDHRAGYYLSGTDTIVTTEMIEAMILNKDQLNYTIPEDAAMGTFFHGRLGAPFLPNRIHFMEKFTNPRWLPWISAKTRKLIEISIEKGMSENKDHYRVKTLKGNRLKIDAAIYRVLLKKIYGIEKVL